MLRRKHLIPHQPPSWKNKYSQKSVRENYFDRWLVRLSHISQFGLFVITLGSLYFVVLPIYQKSILDEAIARKEIELKESEKLVEQSYVQLRKFTLNEFTRGVFIGCIVNYQDVELTKVDDKVHNNLYKDASNCILESKNNSSGLKILRPHDLADFDKELKNVISEIEQHRIVALKEYIELPSKAKLNPALLKPPKYFSRKMNERFEKLYKDLHLNSKDRMAKSRFEAGVHSAQLDVYSGHLDFAKQKLQSMVKGINGVGLD